MEKQRNDGTGYQIAVSGMKGLIKLLLLAVVIIALVFLGRRAYSLGYAAFNQNPVDAGEGRAINVTVTDDMSVGEIGEMLKNAGLLEEEPMVFRLQELLSDYHDKLLPGTYKLRTGMTADEMMRIMAGEDEEYLEALEAEKKEAEEKAKAEEEHGE